MRPEGISAYAGTMSDMLRGLLRDTIRLPRQDLAIKVLESDVLLLVGPFRQGAGTGFADDAEALRYNEWVEMREV